MELSDRALARLVEYGEGEAYASMCQAAGPAAGLEVARCGRTLALLAPRFPVILLNRAIGLGVGEPATEAQVDEMLALYRQAGADSVAVQLSPLARPAALPGWLERRGFVRTDNWAKMYRPADRAGAIPTDLRIEAIGPGKAATFAAVAAAAFGMPPDLSAALTAAAGQPGWQHYLAYAEDTPVATAALYVRGAVGWLGAAGTLPAYRRRGAQGALMTRRINDAVALGCRWLVTETGEDNPSQPNPSYHNMLRTGFRLAYQRANYVATGDAAA